MHDQEFVVDGCTVGSKGFDAVIFGYYKGDRLVYAARTKAGEVEFSNRGRRRDHAAAASDVRPGARDEGRPRRGAAGAQLGRRTKADWLAGANRLVTPA